MRKRGAVVAHAFLLSRHQNSERPYASLSDTFRDEIYGETGVQFMQLNTLYQLMAEKGERYRKSSHCRIAF